MKAHGSSSYSSIGCSSGPRLYRSLATSRSRGLVGTFLGGCYSILITANNPLQSKIRRSMGQIDFTNIIIDDFRKGKLNPFNKYIYILTHIHSDHLRGLSNSWNYGPIYCSQITANLIVNKYPKLEACIRVLPLQAPTKITLAENIVVTVTMFDANHCGGAVMVLLEGYFGRFLYTGDFRFDKKKFSNYTYLYPAQNRNLQFDNCSRPIDKLWLDNTFCNPRFKFMARDEALQIVKDFVEAHPQQKIFIGMDYYGKEEVLVHLAQKLDMIIVVDQQRYQNIIAMELDRELFTTNPEEGRVEVVRKPKLYERLMEVQNSLGLVMSGWSLTMEWRKLKDANGEGKNRIYYVPYSLHSNYEELVSFVKSIRPSMIQPIVSTADEGEGKASNQNLYNTEGNEETFRKLVQNYTSPMSETYKRNLNDREFQQTLKKKFGIDRKSAEINKTELGLNTIAMPARGRGYKLPAQRNEEEINRVKQQVKKRREGRLRPSSEIMIYDSDHEDSELQIIGKGEQFQYKNWAKDGTPSTNDTRREKLSEIGQFDVQELNSIKLISGKSRIEQNFRRKVREMIKNL